MFACFSDAIYMRVCCMRTRAHMRKTRARRERLYAARAGYFDAMSRRALASGYRRPPPALLFFALFSSHHIATYVACYSSFAAAILIDARLRTLHTAVRYIIAVIYVDQPTPPSPIFRFSMLITLFRHDCCRHCFLFSPLRYVRRHVTARYVHAAYAFDAASFAPPFAAFARRSRACRHYDALFFFFFRFSSTVTRRVTPRFRLSPPYASFRCLLFSRYHVTFRHKNKA